MNFNEFLQKTGPVKISLYNTVASFIYFVFIIVLFEAYRLSVFYAYDPGKILPSIFPFFYTFGGVSFLCLFALCALFSRFFAIWKALIFSALTVAAWLGVTYVTTSHESFGYLVVFGFFMIAGYILSGFGVGFLSRFFNATRHSSLLWFVAPVLFIVLISIHILGALHISSANQCASISDINPKINCYTKYALETKDYNQCFYIGQYANNIEEECVINVFKEKLNENSLDSSICSSISMTAEVIPGISPSKHAKPLCDFAYGIVTKNCSGITVPYFSSRCQAYIIRN